MPLDPQVKALLDQMAGLPRLEELSVADARKQVERRIAVNLPTLPIASVLNRTIRDPVAICRYASTRPMATALSL